MEKKLSDFTYEELLKIKIHKLTEFIELSQNVWFAQKNLTEIDEEIKKRETIDIPAVG
jgi:hypothetical protein